MSKPAYERSDLETIINNGGSVMHRGELITHKDNLPSNADIKAAHEGKERVEYRRMGEKAQEAVSTAAGDPTIDGGDPTVPPEGTDAAAALNAEGQPASNAASKETKSV